MSFNEQLIVTLLDKALIGAILLVAGFALNRALEKTKHQLGLDSKRRELVLKSQIDFKEKQLSEFYGPIYALLKQIRPLDDLWNAGKLGAADRSIVAAIRKANDRIVEIILAKSHLVQGDRIPEYFPRFLTHVAVWHAYMDDSKTDWSVYAGLPEAQYDVTFEDEVFRMTEALRMELRHLYDKNAATNA
jgi:hypothetical protein